MYEIQAPAVARKAQAGQFVVVRIHEKGERIPLTVADYDRERGTVTLVVQEVDWELLMARQRMYLQEERRAVETWQRKCQSM